MTTVRRRRRTRGRAESPGRGAVETTESTTLPAARSTRSAASVSATAAERALDGRRAAAQGAREREAAAGRPGAHGLKRPPCAYPGGEGSLLAHGRDPF